MRRPRSAQHETQTLLQAFQGPMTYIFFPRPLLPRLSTVTMLSPSTSYYSKRQINITRCLASHSPSTPLATCIDTQTEHAPGDAFINERTQKSPPPKKKIHSQSSRIGHLPTSPTIATRVSCYTRRTRILTDRLSRASQLVSELPRALATWQSHECRLSFSKQTQPPQTHKQLYKSFKSQANVTRRVTTHLGQRRSSLT